MWNENFEEVVNWICSRKDVKGCYPDVGSPGYPQDELVLSERVIRLYELCRPFQIPVVFGIRQCRPECGLATRLES